MAAADRSTKGVPDSAPLAMRRTALGLWWGLLSVAVGLTAAAAIFGPAIWSRVSDAGKIAAWGSFAMALSCLLASRVLPGRLSPPVGTVESTALVRSALAMAFPAAGALMASLAWLVSGEAIALVALGISLAGLLLAAPTPRRWGNIRRAIEATSGPQLAVDGGPVPSRSRLAMVLLGSQLLGAPALVVLVGSIFWTEEVLHRPSSAVVHALVPLILAVMFTGFAAQRFAGAATHRHPRRQRVHAAVLLAAAVYLLALFVSVLFVRT